MGRRRTRSAAHPGAGNSWLARAARVEQHRAQPNGRRWGAVPSHCHGRRRSRMTCVVGLVENQRVYIGVDSSSVQGWTRRVSALNKVFRSGPFLISYTTSFRMGQLLEHHLKVPKQAEDEPDMSYMVTKFVEAARKLMKDKGYSKVESNAETGGQFLVGYRGHLYSIQNDFQVGEMVEGLDAIGTGSDYALGAMKALEELPPTRRIKKALQITSYFNMGVCSPFYVRSIAA
jgi:ATP-dependent protease HslVU (ClpYQ) peptidase subunit